MGWWGTICDLWFVICDLRFEVLIDHSADEVIEAEIEFLLACLVQRSLRIGFSLELGLEPTSVVLQEFALLVRSRVGKLIGIDEGCSTLCCLSKML